MKKQKRAIIIGAGIGGLATAVRLATKGYDVQVFEANEYTGGKLTEIRKDGFRFDAGPSLFTMPQWVDELFEIAHKNARDYIQYERLDKVCTYTYADGTRLVADADPHAFAREVENKIGVPKAQVLRHLSRSGRIYDITAGLFLKRSLHRISTYLRWSTLWSLLRIPMIHPFSSLDKLHRDKIKHPKMVQFFNRYATYNGSDPYQAPGTLHIIPHLEFHYGAYFPHGGMHEISQSVYRLALDLGVRFHLNTKVSRIMVDNKKAVGVSYDTGIETEANTCTADVVVSNMDVVSTYRHLLRDPQSVESYAKQERSSSALIFYWGVQKTFESLELHNIFFAEDYKAEFKCLFKSKTLYHDPTVYINITSKHNPTDAPEGMENWFVMINAPHQSGQDWDTIIATARKNIINKLSHHLGVDINELIVCEDILDPRTIETRTQSYLGSLYGTASNARLSAFFRHPNFSSKIKNLYFCGGSVHPGGGIPLALSSAKIVADMVE